MPRPAGVRPGSRPPWLLLVGLAWSLSLLLFACAPASPGTSSGASGSPALVVVTAGGTALVDGQADVPPTLDLKISASEPLAPSTVRARLDGAALPLSAASGGAVTASVAPLPLGSAHHLDLEVPGRGAEAIGFHVVPAAGAMAALHADAHDGTVLDVAFQLAPHDRRAVESGLPGGGAVSWPDGRHLRVAWATAPGGSFGVPAGLPVARGSHLAAALRLPLDPVAPGSLRRATEPAPPASPAAGAPLVVAFTAGTAKSRASLAAHWQQVSLVSPTGMAVTSGGGVRGAPDSAAVATAAAHGLPVWPLLQNDASDSAGIDALLSDPAAVGRLVAAASGALVEGGFPGLHLDIEGVPEKDRDHLSDLIHRLAQALHAQGRKLAVAVVPHKPGHLNVYSAAYDLPAISAAADLVTLMAYDEHTSLTGPGAVAGLAWDQQVLAGSLPEMHSPATALLGLPLYARTWAADGGVVADSYAASLGGALSNPGARVDYDFDAATPLVRSADGASSTYFDDAASLAVKLSLAASQHMRGIALWRLGFEDPAWWDALPATAPRP